MTYARSRSRIGARPRITRYARNNADTKALSNPLLQLPLYAGFWGDDPAWTDNPGVGQAVSSWRNGGTLAASGAYLDPTLGLVLPGTAGNYASVPDAAALDITGDITLVFRPLASDWTPAAAKQIANKRGASGNRSWGMVLLTTGALRLVTYADGSTSQTIDSTASVPFVDGQAGWVAATIDVDNGAGGNDVTFWTSTDGTTWTQLGTTVTTGSTTAIYAGTAPVEFGAFSNTPGTEWVGSISVARVYSGSGFTTGGPSGTLVLDVDFRRTSVGAFTCSTGQTVTVSSTFNALQATAGSRPTLTTSALLGGRQVVDFDGTDDRLEITTGVSLAQPFEVWAIASFDVSPNTNAVLGVQSGANARFVGTVSTNTDWYSNLGGSNLVGGDYAANTGYLARWVGNGASSSIFANGESQAAGNPGSFTMDQIVIGAGRTAPSTYANHADMKLAFLGVLPAASITAAHRRQFALWAANFYSVPDFAAAA